jgi:hypothetical protein
MIIPRLPSLHLYYLDNCRIQWYPDYVGVFQSTAIPLAVASFHFIRALRKVSYCGFIRFQGLVRACGLITWEWLAGDPLFR